MTHTSENEIPLEIKKELAREVHDSNLREFCLDSSVTFREAWKKMQGMDHGPNHTEGDPAVHTQLVEWELKNYLGLSGTPLSDTDKRLLRLAGALHDIGKAGTQKFDVVSQRQNELVGASPQEIEVAKALVRTKSSEELCDLSKEGILAGYPAIVVNFRGHDTESAVLSNSVIHEAGIKLTDEEQKFLELILKNHMMFLEPENVSLKYFKKVFVGADGVVNTRMIEMLKAIAYADNAATINKRSILSSDLLERINARLSFLQSEFEKKK